MSVLFTPAKINNVEIKNRFVHSATHEGMAEDNGMVTDRLIKRYVRLAAGEVGLIITGDMYVHETGILMKGGTGIHDDANIPSLARLTSAVHENGGKIMFQLNHAGKSASREAIGRPQMAPSDKKREFFFPLPQAMTTSEIHDIVKAFGQAARRAVEAGADGIQLHSAHGYLINEFLSPFYNMREDEYGGSDENRFRFLREVLLEIKKNTPDGTPVLIKCNSDDCLEGEGITVDLAAKYAGWMVDLGVAGIEISCGFSRFSGLASTRGKLPVKEYVATLPLHLKPLGWYFGKKIGGKFEFEEGYNREAAKRIKPAMGDVPLLLVGGIRNVKFMEEVVSNGEAEFISMCRPFIRQPNLVKLIREGKADSSSCESCNKCFLAVPNRFPTACYRNGYPSRKKVKGEA